MNAIDTHANLDRLTPDLGQPQANQTRDEWADYDLPSVQTQFVRESSKGIGHIDLQLEGVKCGRCGITIEKALRKLPGIQNLVMNVPTARLQLTWNQSEIRLSDILQHLSSIGYAGHPIGKGRTQDRYIIERRRALKRLLVAGLGSMQVMTFAFAVYFGAMDVAGSNVKSYFWVVSMLVATPVVFYSGAPFFVGAWNDIRLGRLGMDVPVALAIGSAYVASVYVTFAGGQHVYFDSATMFVFFLSLGRYFDMVARHQAIDNSRALLDVLPETAIRIVGKEHQVVPISFLKAGDSILIKPGSTIPADGYVSWGRSEVDESLLTGESTPILKNAGDCVVGGSINHSGTLEIFIEKIGQDTTVATIQRLMTDAQAGKPHWGRIADQVAGYFVGGVLIVAALTGIMWWQIDPSRMFVVVLSVLVITCPCALSLAVPTALAAATSALSKRGVLIIKAHTLETLSHVTHFVLDKTGTLTQGKPTITSITVSPNADDDEDYCFRLAASLEYNSEHPFAQAFGDATNLLPIDEQQVHPGQGIQGLIHGSIYRLGTLGFALQSSQDDPLSTNPNTSIYLSRDTQVLARFDLTDRVREGADEFVKKLRSLGIKVSIASGDQESAVKSVARQLGIEKYKHRMSPESKLTYIKTLQRENNVVAMLGDGINDAPVLAGADVSFAMRQGTALAQTSSDALLPGGSLKPIAEAMGLARRAVKTMHGNLIWAVSYNLIALPLAALGLVAPWMAAIGMSISSLIVVANAMRLSVAKTP